MTGKHVILFAGTTEGRVLANWLDEQSGVTGTRLRGNGIRCRASGRRNVFKAFNRYTAAAWTRVRWKPS